MGLGAASVASILPVTISKHEEAQASDEFVIPEADQPWSIVMENTYLDQQYTWLESYHPTRNVFHRDAIYDSQSYYDGWLVKTQVDDCFGRAVIQRRELFEEDNIVPYIYSMQDSEQSYHTNFRYAITDSDIMKATRFYRNNYGTMRQSHLEENGVDTLAYQWTRELFRIRDERCSI